VPLAVPLRLARLVMLATISLAHRVEVDAHMLLHFTTQDRVIPTVLKTITVSIANVPLGKCRNVSDIPRT